MIEEIACPCSLKDVPMYSASYGYMLPSPSKIKKAYTHAGEDELRQCIKGLDGLYYNRKNSRLYIPNRCREPFLWWFHGGPSGGHRGITATRNRMSKFVWWPRLDKDVSNYIKACLPFSRNIRPARSTLA